MNRADVIKVLECCSHDRPMCGSCSYLQIGNCVETVTKEALTLLKEQEPRVLTADEMTELGKTGGAVWVEESPEGSDPKCFWGLVTEGVEPPKDKGYNYPGGVYFNVVDTEQDMWDGDFYGLKTPLGWRAWTAKPTEEQREETPWQD